ncbi:MAG: sugar ABC transporter substrate-binding protein [Roseateles depolymerans]|uniref:Probable sugar-binding periplasmic protein n=1 Tax=Roseateles depolymerans TaxID=76731 RepID=A0A2W5DII4_9BURK|nr:MAG: sugar ABC transporter substrate-binding protein [Roseateles depolymerans]
MSAPRRGRATWALATLLAFGSAAAQPLRSDVVHWWTSGSEAAAVRALAEAYQGAGGRWRDLAVTSAEQAREIARTRIAAGNPPLAAQFNLSSEFTELARQGRLQPLDDVAAQAHWAQVLPPALLDALRIDGHVYGAPLSIHMPVWLWSSTAALRRAGIAREPRSMDELFAALDRLQAAGLVPLAHGGQPWQDLHLFTAVLLNQGGRTLYLQALQQRSAAAWQGDAMRRVLLSFKRLRRYVDAASPGRDWNDSTALLISGRAGLQFMGDWAKGEFAQAGLQAGRDYGCTPGLAADAPYVVDGDVFVFPKGADPAAQRLLARVVTAPDTQLAFSARKGSVPVRMDLDLRSLDPCARLGAERLRDPGRLVANIEHLLPPARHRALERVISDYWNREQPVERVQQALVQALQDPDRRQP